VSRARQRRHHLPQCKPRRPSALLREGHITLSLTLLSAPGVCVASAVVVIGSGGLCAGERVVLPVVAVARRRHDEKRPQLSQQTIGVVIVSVRLQSPRVT
jgi:uncharacterized membrane protein HdeD (DUF308 family)